MKILTFTTLFPNSLEPNYATFLLQRTTQLARREGNQVEVVAPLPYVPKFLAGTARGRVALVPGQETIAGLCVHHPRYPLLPKISMPLHGLLMYAGCLRTVRELHREHGFDCIDAHYVFPDGVAAVLLGKALGIPATVTARGSDIHTFTAFLTLRPQIRWTLRQANGLAAVSASLARIMQQLEPSIAMPAVIGNGVDSQRFFPEERSQARKTIGCGGDEKVIVSVAALKHVKGCDLLVRAASLLKEAVPGCRILFIGKGPDLDSLRRLAEELNCADVCTFAGAIDNELLRHYYSAADASCVPSRNEGWPNVVLESLACGTPVVGTKVGAVPEILADPELGVLVDPSPESIAEGLRQALAREWNRGHIVTYAHAKSWTEVAERVEALLQNTVTEQRRYQSGPRRAGKIEDACEPANSIDQQFPTAVQSCPDDRPVEVKR